MKSKFFIITTIPISLNFFKNQIKEIDQIFDVTLISSPDSLLNDIAEREKVKYKGIEISREINILKDIISLINLVYFFFINKPKVIHCNTPKASLLGLIAGFLTNVPHRIYYIHGFRYEGTTGFKRKLLIGMEKISCFCASNIIAVSNGVKEIANKQITDKKITVIHNGSANGMVVQEFLDVNYNIDEIKSELNILKDDFVYGFVGRIVGDKGINELIESFNLLNQSNKNIKLLLVGRYEDHLDPIKNATKMIIKNNPNIIETGFQTDVKKYLAIMDIFVSPSYREGFGLSLLEANLMGKPVIASDITGYNEIVIEGKNGFLIPKKDANALYKKMEFVYLNRNILSEMKNDCINLVIEKFNHQIVLREAIKYYKEFN